MAIKVGINGYGRIGRNIAACDSRVRTQPANSTSSR